MERVDIAPRILPNAAARDPRRGSEMRDAVSVPARAMGSVLREDDEDFTRSGEASIAPQIGAAAIGGAVSSAKTFMSVSNEYWLIGIIIVLVTVILMLIVYIVKIRQTKQEAETDATAHPDKPHPATPEGNSDERLQRLSHRPFVPRSARTGPQIEAVDEDSTEESPKEDEAPREAQGGSMPFSMCRDAQPIVMPAGPAASAAPAASAGPVGGANSAADANVESANDRDMSGAPSGAADQPAAPARRGRRRPG